MGKPGDVSPLRLYCFAACDVCVVVVVGVMMAITIVLTAGGVAVQPQHHPVHGTQHHNSSRVDEPLRMDNALDGGRGFDLVHIHYLHIAMATSAATGVQHTCMAMRSATASVLLVRGVGAETSVHSFVVNVLAVLMSAEISGLATWFSIAVSVALHALSMALATAVLLHNHGAPTSNDTQPGCMAMVARGLVAGDVEGGHATPPCEPARGRGRGRSLHSERVRGRERTTPGGGAEYEDHKEHKEHERALWWFGACRLHLRGSHPPHYTTQLARTARAVAVALCLLPWVWVAVYYVGGIQAPVRPAVTIVYLPPVLLIFCVIKVGWVPGIAWARTAENTARTYYVEALFDTIICFVMLFCALADLAWLGRGTGTSASASP